MVSKKETALVLGIAALGAVLLLWPHPSHAASGPAYFGSVGANGAWFDGTGTSWPADFEANGNLWGSVSPHIDLGAEAQYGFSHSYLAGEGWVKVTATDVDDTNFSMFLSAGYGGGSVSALQPSEWKLGAGFGWVPFPETWSRFIVTGKAERGQESHRLTVRLGGRYYFPVTF